VRRQGHASTFLKILSSTSFALLVYASSSEFEFVSLFLPTLLFLRLRMLVNLNSSTQVELMHLPHVAEARSRRIWLKEGGGFKSSDDFCSRGIGFGGKGILWAEISQFVSFGPESKRYNESASMEYDREMATRLARQRIYNMPEGPGHPWGATWTR
jgi:hypothetical protein